MARTVPSALTWTLKFKNGKSTTVLHVDPLQSFDSIKEELLLALRETHPDGEFNGRQIPDKLDDVLMARLTDLNDIDGGFTSLVDDDGNLITEIEPVNKKRKTDGGGFKLKDQCPTAAGLRDGCILAFKFREGTEPPLEEDANWDVTMARIDNTDDGSEA